MGGGRGERAGEMKIDAGFVILVLFYEFSFFFFCKVVFRAAVFPPL